ncbi:MAG: hypothetical protein PHG29_13055 [Prolixibacteraceae bacterium]|nr:hypothetical protein [Prolixibacteraceae bacterium]
MKIFRIILFILIMISGHLNAQFTAGISVEGGKNYVSSGFYSDVVGEISSSLCNWYLAVSAGLGFSEAKENFFNAIKMDVSRDFSINKRPLTGHAFYQWRPFSDLLHEHNAGIIFNFRSNKFGYLVGLNTRFFKLPNQYSETKGYNHVHIWEPINLLYKITYFQPLSEQWDLQVSVTNFDAFMIQQETNPMLITRVGYQTSTASKMYIDLGYLQAGLLNIRVNYFGYFMRGGFQWVL